jgi:hypothetical protein
LSDFFSLIWIAGTDEISPKVLQALGSEPIQVRPQLQPLVQLSPAQGWIRAQADNKEMTPGNPQPAPHSALCLQYAVPVVKYDRKGYKPRSRQLLLTPNAVVIVEDAKVKQRIDYANLTGQPESGLLERTPAVTLDP